MSSQRETPRQPAQGSATLHGKEFFLMLRQNFLRFILRPLLLVLSLSITEKGLARPLTPLGDIYVH